MMVCFLIYGRVKVAQLKEAAATLGLQRDHGEHRIIDSSTQLQVDLLPVIPTANHYHRVRFP